MVRRATTISAIRVPRCAHADPVHARSPGAIDPAALAIPRVTIRIGADAAAAALAGLAAFAVAAYRAGTTFIATIAAIGGSVDGCAFVLLRLAVETAALVRTTDVTAIAAVLLGPEAYTGSAAVGSGRANATANNIADFSRFRAVVAALGAIGVCMERSTLPLI
jgi:hypothetical protein